MAKIFGLKEIELRKRALIAESEVYRQTLTLEIQNLRIYKVRMEKKLALFRLANPLFLLGGSFLGSRLFGRRRPERKRRGKWRMLIGAGLMGWRLFRQYGPLAQRLINQAIARKQQPRPTGTAAEAQSPAANI